jgi:hypothetical protein
MPRTSAEPQRFACLAKGFCEAADRSSAVTLIATAIGAEHIVTSDSPATTPHRE